MQDKDYTYMLTIMLYKDLLGNGILDKEMFSKLNKDMIEKYKPLIEEEFL